MIGFFKRYARFTAFLVIGIAATAALSMVIDFRRALLIGFDIGVLAFVALLASLFATTNADSMRKRAADNDPDQFGLTLLGIAVAAIVLVALFVELTGAGGRRGLGVAIAGITLLLAWVFANLLFAMHYAHIWYLPGSEGEDCQGLQFPGTDATPGYWDFTYYAFVLGMTFQVSDVQTTSSRMRRLALFHGLGAFVFNIVVIAMSVSLVASALGG